MHWVHRNYNTNKINKAIENDFKQHKTLMRSTGQASAHELHDAGMISQNDA